MHVFAAAVGAVSQIMLLIHNIEADAALFIFFERDTLHLSPHLINKFSMINSRLLIFLRLLNHNFLSCFANTTVGVDLVAVEFAGDCLIPHIQNLGYLCIKVTILP